MISPIVMLPGIVMLSWAIAGILASPTMEDAVPIAATTVISKNNIFEFMSAGTI